MKSFVFGLVVALAVAAVAAAQPPITTIKDLPASTNANRIIDGEPAVVGQFPWQVAVHFTTSSGTFFCGGALISEQWVLTAAHCAYGATSFTLRLGGITIGSNEEGRVEVISTDSYVHENYNPNTLNNDIALVKLPNPVSLNNRIQTVALPSRGEVVGVGKAVTVSGWGKTSDASSSVSSILNYVGLSTISNDDCRAIYGNSVIASTVCCKGNPHHSTCNGDSGGPLVVMNSDGSVTHVGIVSFVHINGCESGMPSGYVRTESFLSWIHDKTGIPI